MQQDEAEAVASFLRAHPDFLAENPGLYDGLAPPVREHGSAATDHMAAMLRRSREQADAARRVAEATAADRRAADGFVRRVQGAVLALMRAADPATVLLHELPALLHLDGVRLCAEGAGRAGAAAVAPGTVGATLGRRPAVIRAAVPDAALHGEVAALAVQEALVRVKLRSGPALLALLARDEGGLEGATTDALLFLADAVAAALERPAP